MSHINEAFGQIEADAYFNKLDEEKKMAITYRLSQEDFYLFEILMNKMGETKSGLSQFLIPLAVKDALESMGEDLEKLTAVFIEKRLSELPARCGKMNEVENV